jgi:DNA-binding transcriptional LysR family regulator
MVGRGPAESQSYNLYEMIMCRDIISSAFEVITWSPTNFSLSLLYVAQTSVCDSGPTRSQTEVCATRLDKLKFVGLWRPIMDINQLEVVVAVAREKSFSRAAETLHRTQPAVSQAIRRLEAELGEPLFDRSSKDGTLTAAGVVLFEFAQQMLNLRHHAHTALKELKDLHRGKLTLSANEYTVMYLLPLVPLFRARHPHIKIEVKRSLASRIASEILGRETELGIVSFKPNDPTVAAMPVLMDELALIVAPEHPLAAKATVSVRELGAESFIAHNVPSPYRERVIRTFEKYKTPLNISMELPTLEAIKRFVERGMGVALVPRLTAQAEIARGQLAALTVREMKLERRLHLIYRKGATLSHAARAFLRVAKELQKAGA